MKEITTLTVKLLVICAVVAAILAAVNGITKPIIEENNQKTFEASMKEVIPDASSFEEADIQAFQPKQEGVTVESLHRADCGGCVVSVTCSEGYGGDVSVMVGVDKDLKVTQAKIMAMSETPGLGAKSTEPEFINQYRGLTQGVEIVKNQDPTGNQIRAISGATITSKAVTKSINTALEAAEQYLNKGGDKK